MPNFWEDPIQFIAEWLRGLLTGLGLQPGAADVVLMIIGAGLLATSAMLFTVFLIWYERKLYGRIQDRLGPNRVGPWGIFQTFADMGKIFTKELITPIGVDKIPYNLAPILSVAAVLLIWAVIPFAPNVVGVPLSVGILFVVAAGGFGELAIVMAGWGSNNKYAMLGGFRAVALLIAYEIPLVLSLLIPAMLAGSMNLVDVVAAQNVPFILMAPVAALVFFICLVAESGRSPFDLIEAESEIVAGFNTEYSGLKFGMFFVAEFLHAFTASLLFSTIFLGGYRGPFVEQFPLLGIVYLLIKTFIVYFFTILFRGSLPRLRMDQMLNLNWKVLTPMVLVLVFATAFVDKLVVLGFAGLGDGALTAVRVIALLVMNGLVFWVSMRLLSNSLRVEPAVVSHPRPLATPAGPSGGQD
jgi:NADH-quinone oxidoreductase subunit H